MDQSGFDARPRRFHGAGERLPESRALCQTATIEVLTGVVIPMEKEMSLKTAQVSSLRRQKNSNKKELESIKKKICSCPFKFEGGFETSSSLSGFDSWSGKKKVECVMTVSSRAVN